MAHAWKACWCNSLTSSNLVFSASRVFGAIRKPFFHARRWLPFSDSNQFGPYAFCRVMPSNDVGYADIDDTLGDTHDGPNRCVTLSSKGTPACSLIPIRRRMRLTPPTSASSSGNVMLHVYTFLLFLHAEKSNERWNFNVFAYTFTLVPLSRRTSAFQNPSKPLESLGFLAFFKFAKV